MRFKRTSSALLAAALTATSMGIYSYAAEDEVMKTELTYVKQRIDIPEKYSEFSHYTYTNNGKTTYNFSWSTPGGADDYGGITVQITGKVITSIFINDPDRYTSERSFAKLSDSKILAAAKKYINAINPTISSQIKIDDDSLKINLYGTSATLGFHREVNGVPVTGQTGTVTVNKDTGELQGYYLNWVSGATFSDKIGAISVEDAKKSYEKYFDSELIYTISNDYDSEKEEWVRSPHLMYRQTDRGQLNAFTGLVSDYADYDYYGDDVEIEDDDYEAVTVNDANPATGADEVRFTDAEIKKLEEEGSLITAEEALEQLKKMGIFFIPEGSYVSSQNSYYNDYGGYYVRNVSFTSPYADYIDLNNEDIVKPLYTKEDAEVYGSFTINAETGTLLSFNNFSQDTGKDLAEKTTLRKAENALKKLLGDNRDKFGTLEQTSDSHISERTDKETGEVVPGTPRTTKRTYGTNRFENEIKCAAENVSITISNNGYVTGYYLNFDNNIEYPKPEKIITKSDAYVKFFENVEFGLKYRCAYNTKDKRVVTALVYAADNLLCIDAFTGKPVNYQGGELTVNENTDDYTDLENSKYKKYAEKLAKYGIKLMDKDGKLNETETITAGDFITLISNLGMYPRSNANKNAAVTLPKDSAKLARRTAAQLLVISKYGYQLAELTSMYKSPFSDVKDGSKYVGYITIADATGLLKGKDGKYSPKSAVTRGEALKIVYDLLAQ